MITVRKTLLLLTLLAAVAHAVRLEGIKMAVFGMLGVHTHHKLQCADCMQLAEEVTNRLVKPPDVNSDDPGIAVGGPSRRSRLVFHKEPEIDAALDAGCELLAASGTLADGMLEDCQRLMAEHKSALNDAIFSQGTAGLAATMCATLFGVCDPHVLTDMAAGGEL